MPDQHPDITAYFVEPDEHATPLLLAIGRVVFAAAGLENNLRLDLLRQICEREVSEHGQITERLAAEAQRTEALTGGQLLSELRSLDLSTELDARLGDAIGRRNRLVHQLMEEPELVRAITKKEPVDAALEKLERLALDCAALSLQLQAVALPKLESVLGGSATEFATALASLDPADLDDPRGRRQLEALQALGDVELPTLDTISPNLSAGSRVAETRSPDP